MKFVNKVPDFEKKEAVVKLTTAAVYKEGYILKKKEAEEQKKIKDFEMNLRDEKEYERWRKETE